MFFCVEKEGEKVDKKNSNKIIKKKRVKKYSFFVSVTQPEIVFSILLFVNFWLRFFDF